ncbi:Mth938-like domain-containing protein [Oceanibacterium hippocampi]|uniref:Uncharacterized protein n=1 Tax=Oceanibacterium hippocampi TaxID=745714 RepID=A0A1Y5T822_9PROT|nr:Mth938-like domain-containing protein [Oceanibacterium hippocampi]SLN55906.1 hypothetical protein OCH7691_02403 [Oceanibacterium hippocampi]
MDITPRLASGRQLINGYGDGGFRVAGTAHAGSVLVFPDRTVAWPVTAFADLDIASLEPVLAAAPAVEILLIGAGAAPAFLDPEIRARIRSAGIVTDVMDSGAAARTFNVLLLEDRRVAAALIAVD